MLQGGVGTSADPDAYVIYLTKDGAPFRQLPAGNYKITISDPSTMHNFHLSGPVDRATGVAEVTEVTWDVTLVAGQYRFLCDPHPGGMEGEDTFRVS